MKDKARVRYVDGILGKQAGIVLTSRNPIQIDFRTEKELQQNFHFAAAPSRSLEKLFSFV